MTEGSKRIVITLSHIPIDAKARAIYIAEIVRLAKERGEPVVIVGMELNPTDGERMREALHREFENIIKKRGDDLIVADPRPEVYNNKEKDWETSGKRRRIKRRKR